MSRYHVDGIFINRWDGSGMCYCEHCRSNFNSATGFDLPRTDNPQNPARRAYIALAAAAAFRSLATLGYAKCARSIPTPRVIPNTGGGATSSLDMKTHRRTGSDTLFADRQARRGLTAALGERQERQRISRHHGAQAHRRHLQRWPRRTVSLEGFRSKRRRNPALGGRWHRQRLASVVHEILRHTPRRALAQDRRGALQPALSTGKNICATKNRWRESAWFIRSRPAWFYGGTGRARKSKITPSAGTRH